VISAYAWEQLGSDLQEQINVTTQSLRQLLSDHPELADLELNVARTEMLRAQRGVLLDLRRRGTLSDELFESLAVEIDRAMPEHISDEH
jgi:hypothetical protein